MPVWFLKYVLPAIAVGLLIWGAMAWRAADISHWKSVGREELATEIAQAAQEAEAKAREKQAAIRKQSQEVEHEVRKAQGADAPASPYLRGVLDRMRAAD